MVRFLRARTRRKKRKKRGERDQSTTKRDIKGAIVRVFKASWSTLRDITEYTWSCKRLVRKIIKRRARSAIAQGNITMRARLAKRKPFCIKAKSDCTANWSRTSSPLPYESASERRCVPGRGKLCRASKVQGPPANKMHNRYDELFSLSLEREALDTKPVRARARRGEKVVRKKKVKRKGKKEREVKRARARLFFVFHRVTAPTHDRRSYLPSPSRFARASANRGRLALNRCRNRRPTRYKRRGARCRCWADFLFPFFPRSSRESEVYRWRLWWRNPRHFKAARSRPAEDDDCIPALARGPSARGSLRLTARPNEACNLTV